MRAIKYILMVVMSLAMFTSCFDDDTSIDLNDDGYNVAGFFNNSETLATVADGQEYQFTIKVKLIGPTVMELENDITFGFEAAEGSTAIEGTHYRIEDETLTLSKDNNYLGLVTITMLTDGIEPPLDESPVLLLGTTGVTGDDRVVGTGKPCQVTFNYACFSDLAGTYSVTVLRDGAEIHPYANDQVVISVPEGGIYGEYRTDKVGHWNDLGVGTPGFTFYDVCGEITIPGQNLVDYYGNWVNQDGLDKGVVNEDGSIELSYKITSAWESLYEWTLVPVK